jgi:diguanylate cyclase (GGDEF)-like protein/PAS domain S-box-containing protein
MVSYMQDNDKSTEMLLEELNGLRLEVLNLKESEARLKQTEKNLRENEDKFRTIAQTAVDAIILADVHGNIIFWNESALRIFGYTEEEIAGKPLTILMPEQYIDAHQKGLQRIKSTGKSRYIGKTTEMHALRKNGDVFPIELSVAMWKSGEDYYYSGILRDITKRKKLESKLETLAVTDTLTQVFNRIKYYEIMKRETERTKRYDHPLSIIMFDIDRFKEVNDTYGHTVGDYVLRTLTQIVKKNLRETDYLVRWGGEEFIIIAPDTDLKKAKILAERNRKASEKYKYDHAGQITVSFGVTQFMKDDNEDTVIKRADDALYEAKRKGRNRVEVNV